VNISRKLMPIIVSVLSIVIGLGAGVAAPANARSLLDFCKRHVTVVLYEHANCLGEGVLWSGNNLSTSFTGWHMNDRGSSLYVPKAVSVSLYDGPLFNGKLLYRVPASAWQDRVFNLPRGVNDKTSSYFVCVIRMPCHAPK